MVVVDLNDYLWVSLILIAVYGRILIIAIRQHNKIVSDEIPTAIRSRGGGTEEIQTDIVIAKKKRKEFKATRLTAAIVCPYVLFWLPFHVARALQAYGNQQGYITTMLDLGLALGSTIQAVDWMIYGILNK